MYTETTAGRPTGNAIDELANALAERVANFVRRRRFKRLLDLDDRMLDDIGVHRGEVEYAVRLPLSVDAGTELRRISLARRRNRM